MNLQKPIWKIRIPKGQNFTFQDWYTKVLDACGLKMDLQQLSHGDFTEIGERGITLSGGPMVRGITWVGFETSWCSRWAMIVQGWNSGFPSECDFLGGGLNHFYFHPYLGKISNLTNIFQMGWNHQPARVLKWMWFLYPPSNFHYRKGGPECSTKWF